MELTPGLLLTGREFRPFDPGVGGAPMPDLAAGQQRVAAADASG